MSGFLQMADGRRVPAADGLTIGRLASCGVQIGDTKASRKHAALRVEGSVVELEDLDSSNGTLLNGKPVRRRVLRDGDVVRIGTTEIEYRLADSLPEASLDSTAETPAIAPRRDVPSREVIVEELDFAESGDDQPAGGAPSAAASSGGVDTNPSIGEDLFASSEPEVLEFADDEVVPLAPPPAAPSPTEPPQPVRSEPVRPEPTQSAPAQQPSRPASRPARDEPVVARREAKSPAAKNPTAERSRVKGRTRSGGAAEDVGGGGQGGPREHGVLKFQSSPGRGGLLGDDLGQMSNGKRTLLVLIAVVVAVGLGVLAMQMSG